MIYIYNIMINTIISTWTNIEHKKSRSPNSLYFYIKKGFSLEDAEKQIIEFRKKIYSNRKPVPTQIEYWINKGFSKEDAFVKRQEFGKLPMNLDFYIKRFGIELGTKKYNIRKEKITSKEAWISRIKKFSEKNNLSMEDAHAEMCKRNKKISPRCVEYWESKGFSKEDSIKKVSIWQSQQSPRSVFYWILNGYSETDAIKKVSQYQDNVSLEAIQERYKCSIENAYKIQDEIFKKIENSKILNGYNLDKAYLADFYLYKKEVLKQSERTYKLYKNEIDSTNIRGVKNNIEHHLDHIVSIKDGFINSVPTEIISSKYNLKILSLTDNCKKQCRSEGKIEDLIKLYENKNK